jgi:hypothetical protein
MESVSMFSSICHLRPAVSGGFDVRKLIAFKPKSYLIHWMRLQSLAAGDQSDQRSTHSTPTTEARQLDASLIDSLSSLYHVTQCIDLFLDSSSGPMNAEVISRFVGKLAVMGMDVVSGDANAFLSINGPQYVYKLCCKASCAFEEQGFLEGDTVVRIVWSLAELSQTSVQGKPLLCGDDRSVQVVSQHYPMAMIAML